MNKLEEMNNFLKCAYQIIKETKKEYPDIYVDYTKLIYRELCNYNVPKNDVQKNIEDPLFNNWINNFKEKENIDVFQTQNWKYFCQFTNEKDITINNNYDPVKIYVPTDSQHLEKTVNDIFTFFENNNIPHHSKVACKIRTDNIVIRIPTIKDANKLLNYINSNNYIQEGLMNPNPFCFNIGKIGLALDAKKSYNLTLSNEIKNFISKNINNEENININNFNNYINNNKNMYDENTNDILQLINLATKQNRDINDYSKHYNYTNNKIKKRKEQIKKNSYEYKKEILDKALTITYQNHNANYAYNAIINYVIHNNSNGFSRYEDNNKTLNWRNIIVENITPIEMKTIIKVSLNNNTDSIKQLAYQYINEKLINEKKKIKA